MASPKSRIIFRIMTLTLLLLLLFYIGRPLYWKISATVHDIRNNKQTVRQGTLFFNFTFSTFNFSFLIYLFPLFLGFSQIVIEAQKSVGWYPHDSDSLPRSNSRKLLHIHTDFSRVVG